jgi:hypothetical protein
MKYCINCNRRAVYGMIDEGATRCLTHKTADMVDIRSRLCNGLNSRCQTRASFGFPGEQELFCSVHSVPGMINIRRRNIPAAVVEPAIFDIADYLV